MNIQLNDPSGSSADWYDCAYKKFESLWNVYSLQLDIIYKRTCELWSQSPESAAKYGELKNYIERSYKMLKAGRASFKDLSRDKIGILFQYLEEIKKLINCGKQGPASQQQMQQRQPPGSQPQLPEPEQRRDMKVPRCEAANSSRIPAQHFKPSSQENKINAGHVGSVASPELKIGVRSMGRQTRHQLVQVQNLNQPIQQTLLNPKKEPISVQKMYDATGSKLGQVAHNSPGILQKHHSVGQVRELPHLNASSPRTSLQSSSQLHQENLFSSLSKAGTAMRNDASDPKVSSTSSPLSTSSLSLDSPKNTSTVSPLRAADSTNRSQGPAKDDQILSQAANKERASSTGSPKILASPLMEEVPQNSRKNASTISPLSASGRANHLEGPTKDDQILSQTTKEGQASSTGSPKILASPLMEEVPQNSRKNASTISPLSAAESANHPQGPAKDDRILSLTTNEVQASSIGSPLMAEVTLPEENQTGNSDESSLQRLLDMVKSISNEALCAALQDIDSIMNTIDTIGGTTVNCESQAFTYYQKDLLQGGNFNSLYGTASARRIERHFGMFSAPAEVTASDGLQGLSSQTNYLESTAECRTKMPKFQPNTALMDEIKEINKRLVETALDLVYSTKNDSNAGFGEGTIIRCSYSPVGLDRNIKLQSSASGVLPLFSAQLLVPADYPSSSPILLNDSFSILSEEAVEECDDLTKKVNTRFSSWLRVLSQPLSLKEMARKWDDCARSVLAEFAVTTGGGSFSTKYGKWEKCI